MQFRKIIRQGLGYLFLACTSALTLVYKSTRGIAKPARRKSPVSATKIGSDLPPISNPFWDSESRPSAPPTLHLVPEFESPAHKPEEPVVKFPSELAPANAPPETAGPRLKVSTIDDPNGDWMRGDLFQEMERFIRTQRSKHTQRAYQTDLKQFVSWLRAERYSPGIDALLEYRDWLVLSADEGGAGLSRSSANRKFATVRSFLGWLQGRGFLKENPAIWVKNFRAKTESPTQGFSDSQVARVLDMASRYTASGLQHSLVLHILFYMGLRRSEIVAIRCSHFGQARVEENVVTTLRVQGKGDKERILPVPDKVLDLLKEFLARNDLAIGMDRYLFRAIKCNVPRGASANPRKNEDTDLPLNTNTIAYIVKKYAKKAGIDAQVSPHSCRATCISNALDQGATHRSVQQMAGWSSPLMIERYDKRRTSLKDSAVHIVKYP